MAGAKSIEQKLKERMETAIEVGDCLEWQGHITNRSKVPVISHRTEPGKNATRLPVPRLLYEQSGKTVRKGHMVYRNCCNNLCVKLEHIVSGTKKQWHANRKKKGLTKHSISTKLKITQKARARPTTINSLEKAMEIRLMASAGISTKEISEKTGASEAMVCDIRRNHSWKQSGGFFTGLMR